MVKILCKQSLKCICISVAFSCLNIIINYVACCFLSQPDGKYAVKLRYVSAASFLLNSTENFCAWLPRQMKFGYEVVYLVLHKLVTLVNSFLWIMGTQLRNPMQFQFGVDSALAVSVYWAIARLHFHMLEQTFNKQNNQRSIC